MSTLKYRIAQNDRTKETFFWHKDEWVGIDGDFQLLKGLCNMMRDPQAWGKATHLCDLIRRQLDKKYPDC